MSGIVTPGIRMPKNPPGSRFPLRISANGRYFTDRLGKPFFFLMDAGWEAPTQLSNAQIALYLANRKSMGFTAVIIEMTQLLYSSQSPTYLNQAGLAPFSTITAQGSTPFGASACDFSSAGGNYWNTVDFLIQTAYNLEMAVIAFPAYVGFPTTPRQGWYDCLVADTAAHLQTYGQFIANRYGSFGNIIWGMAGDNSLSQADLLQNWNIVTGMRSVRTDQLIYIKGQRHTSGYALINTDGGSYPGFNVNNAYIGNSSGTSYSQVSDSLTEYARSPALPFFVDECDYDFTGVATPNDCRRALWGPLLSGACGVTYGNEMVWGFGCANNEGTIGPAAVLTDTYLYTSAAQHAGIYGKSVSGFPWYNLVPKTDTSLVTTSLSTGAATICPAITSDGAFALIYTGSGTGFTLNLTAFSKSVRARWLDPTTGIYTAIATYPNTGTQAFTTPGANAAGDNDFVLVMD